MKKFITKFLIILLITLLPVFSYLSYGKFIQQHKYEDSFYAEMKYKAERLENIEDKKIVFIGGSSLAFGLRSDEIEKATGYKVVNFGLYATLGSKVMLDLAIDYINEGDIVIFAPELHEDTYSLMVNYRMLHKCFENKPSLNNKLSIDDRFNMFVNYFAFIQERIGLEVNPSEPYTLSSFNEYGDIDSDVVKQNVLYSLYDKGQLVSPSKKLINDDFVKYLNKYNRKIEKKKATMYLSFSPTNRLSYVSDNTDAFESLLNEKLDFDLLGSVDSFVYHEDYFYDTNYHLNYSGSLLHSKMLSSLIKDKLNIENDYEIIVPERPMPRYVISDEEDYSSYFVLKKFGNTYSVSNIQDEYKDSTKIIVPNQINDLVISGVMSGAFANMDKLETIILPETIEQLDGDIFTNCPNLTRIYLLNESAPLFVGNGLLNGANPNCKIYVLESAISSYTTGYTWSNYITNIRTFKMEEIR